jgi:hypothetical protein
LIVNSSYHGLFSFLFPFPPLSFILHLLSIHPFFLSSLFHPLSACLSIYPSIYLSIINLSIIYQSIIYLSIIYLFFYHLSIISINPSISPLPPFLTFSSFLL